MLSHLEKTDLPATIKSWLPGAVAISPRGDWSSCDYKGFSSWSCWYLTLRRLISLQLWRVVFPELLLSHWRRWWRRRLIFLQLRRFSPGAVAISPWEDWSSCIYKDCLSGAVAILPREDWSLQLWLLSSWSCCYATLRRLIFLQLRIVVFPELLLSHLEKTDLPAIMNSCLPGAVATSPWEDWSSCNYEELSSWSCCYFIFRRLIFLQLKRVVFLELLLPHLEKTDLPATMKSCLPGGCCYFIFRRLIFLQLKRVVFRELFPHLKKTNLTAIMKSCLPGAVAISPWEVLSSHNHWDPEEQRLSLFPLSGWYHLH